jgi:DUF971 family protein
MAVDPGLKPNSLRRDGDGLLIEWSDGARTHVSWAELRKKCPCATCLERESKPPDPLRILTPQEATAGAPEPVQMIPRGYYAYQIVWNDGHDTGIYSIDYLRQISKPAQPAAALQAGGKES